MISEKNDRIRSTANPPKKKDDYNKNIELVHPRILKSKTIPLFNKKKIEY